MEASFQAGDASSGGPQAPQKLLAPGSSRRPQSPPQHAHVTGRHLSALVCGCQDPPSRQNLHKPHHSHVLHPCSEPLGVRDASWVTTCGHQLAECLCELTTAKGWRKLLRLTAASQAHPHKLSCSPRLSQGCMAGHGIPFEIHVAQRHSSLPFKCGIAVAQDLTWMAVARAEWWHSAQQMALQVCNMSRSGPHLDGSHKG